MSDLINRQAAIDELIAMRKHIDAGMSIIGGTAYEMAIEALREPERKKGKWIYDMHGFYKCSHCGITTYIPDNRSENYHFCRWCGVEMSREESDNGRFD